MTSIFKSVIIIITEDFLNIMFATKTFQKSIELKQTKDKDKKKQKYFKYSFKGSFEEFKQFINESGYSPLNK